MHPGYFPVFFSSLTIFTSFLGYGEVLRRWLNRRELADLYLSQGLRRKAGQTLAAMKVIQPELRKSLASQMAEKFLAADKPDLADEILKAAGEPARPD